MTIEMTLGFSVLALFGAAVMGLVKWRLTTFIIFALIFLNFVWGIWLGFQISHSNEFIWFGTPLFILIAVQLLLRAFFPALWRILQDKNNYP